MAKKELGTLPESLPTLTTSDFSTAEPYPKYGRKFEFNKCLNRLYTDHKKTKVSDLDAYCGGPRDVMKEKLLVEFYERGKASHTESLSRRNPSQCSPAVYEVLGRAKDMVPEVEHLCNVIRLLITYTLKRMATESLQMRVRSYVSVQTWEHIGAHRHTPLRF